MLVNKSKLADIVGRTQQQITTWQRNGLPHRKGTTGTANEYDTAEVIEWLTTRNIGDDRNETQKERKDRLDGDMRELDIAEKLGVLVPAGLVAEVWEGQIVAARQEFVAGLAKIRQAVSSEHGITIGQNLLDECATNTLAHLAEHGADPAEDSADGLPAVGDAGEINHH